jgi:ELWxxDGT repeat protein
VVGNTLYFRAFTLTNGYELWKTDGTTTSLVADITPGESSSSPGFLTAVGNTLFFAATDPTSGRELWKTDGTTTSRVADIRPGVFQFSPGSSYPEDLTAFFQAFDGISGYELWKTDGTTTSRVADIRPGGAGSSSNPRNLTAVGNTLFFTADDGSSGRELWKTDGTTTSRVADIRPGVFQFSPGSSYPEDLTAVGNTLFFTANDGSSGRELWKTDGTTTSRVANIFPGEGNSNPRNLTVVGRAS